jgi:hypothetical protein
MQEQGTQCCFKRKVDKALALEYPNQWNVKEGQLGSQVRAQNKW